MSRRPWTAAAVLVAMACTFYLAACGGSDTKAPVVKPAVAGTPPNLVEDDAIRRAPAGSPQRTILEWAQAIQFVDPRAVMELYSPAALRSVNPARIDRAVRTIRTLLGRPQFVRTTMSGTRHARVRAFLVSYDASHLPSSRQPITFDLVRIGRGWRLDDTAPLLDMYDELSGNALGGKASAAPDTTPTG